MVFNLKVNIDSAVSQTFRRTDLSSNADIWQHRHMCTPSLR